MIDSRIAAEYLLALAKSRKIYLSATQLHKLLFIIYGVCLANEVGGDTPIFDETPQAWPYGPVFPKVQKVNRDADYDPDSERYKDLRNFQRIFENVLNRFGGISAKALSDWSHKEGSPWYQTTKRVNFKWSDQIDNNAIKLYFQGKKTNQVNG
ncbi:Panacea domain-containing protein [Flectobacillus longus]|uniref:Panacea domain-containing protein n=1 Tax=Flectobacillus longus TaxID=2984207 RepID=UPI0024B874F2|nr:type II toxin-antitoxin system antitoxin SocA domain-containing protein [Flectobacillus longus]MDI9880782.1 DUF4065 domain-containing protein [Flectobacillus longus]